MSLQTKIDIQDKDMKRRLMVIDGHALLHRAYHALPRLTTKKGELVNAIYGFFLIFLKAFKDLKPDFIVTTFDLPSPTFRHEKFKEYKATRPKIPDDLSKQIPRTKEVLKILGIPIFEKEGFEADDIIGTIAKLAPRKQIVPKLETIIVSGDLDNLQLVDSNTKVYTLRKGIKDTIIYDGKAIRERYGLRPSQLVDFKALKGDPSDNIPGIPGVGEKTAISLLQEFDNLENLYQELEKKTDKTKALKTRTKNLLARYKEQAFFSKTLAKIKKDVDIDFDLKNCDWKKYNKEKAIQAFKDLEFNTLIKRLPEIKSK
jgi:DNA polymerase-1